MVALSSRVEMAMHAEATINGNPCECGAHVRSERRPDQMIPTVPRTYGMAVRSGLRFDSPKFLTICGRKKPSPQLLDTLRSTRRPAPAPSG